MKRNMWKGRQRGLGYIKYVMKPHCDEFFDFVQRVRTDSVRTDGQVRMIR